MSPASSQRPDVAAAAETASVDRVAPPQQDAVLQPRELSLRFAWSALQQTYAQWSAHGATRLAAALAFYTMFSLAPLLVVAIAVAGIFLGRDAVRGELMAQMAGLIGRDGASAIEDLIAHAGVADGTLMATVVGFAILLFGASNVVGELKASFNTIWNVPVVEDGWVLGLVRERLVSFALVLGIGFVLLVSLLISAGLAAASRYLHGDAAAGLWMVVNAAVTICIETGLFALMFKILPDAPVRWADVWVGAFCTAVMFELGKLLVGLYLGQAGLASAYGAAGSFVVVLLWVYYSAQILFFGAELTQVIARRRGHTAPTSPEPALAPRNSCETAL